MSSFQRILVTVALVLTATVSTAEDNWLHLGEPLKIDEATPIGEILENPAAFHDREVRIEGRVASVCNEEGCFIEVVPTGGGEGIVVNFPGLVHTFPLDCAGLEAVVEGRFYQKIYPHARVEHWQHHSFRPGVQVPFFSLAFRMDARGVRLGGSRSKPPPPAPIRIGSGNRVDLGMMGFEAEAFGIDRRSVAPGEVVPRPSTGGNRWMVLCHKGKVAVNRADGWNIPLHAGEMSFVPAGVLFEVRNTGVVDASIDLIYAKKIEPSSLPH
ncbi:MAG: DUF4920 domain-containing protein [Acidobacteria bacterium]|nr:DUF4920 domain-containing protein [Acidobacteriota bacterium]